MTRPELTIVEGGAQAGIVVWWELTGSVGFKRLIAALEDEGICADSLLPSPTTLEVALRRAAYANLPSERSMLRSTTRGAWEAFAERKTEDAERDGRVEFDSLAIGKIVQDPATKQRSVVLKPTSLAGHAFCAQVRSSLPAFIDDLYAEEVSSWLLNLSQTQWVQAVGLRNRGGFYFIPNQHCAFWRAVIRATRSCTAHQFYELPAMHTEDCARAVLKAVRDEAESAFAELNLYLEGPVSTKGINSAERRGTAVTQKLQQYVGIFQTDALGDLTEMATTLAGAVATARIAKDVANDAE